MSIAADQRRARRALDRVFNGPGGIPLLWQTGTRCDCYSTTGTRQPDWNCTTCSGYGVVYAPAVTIRGLFRSQGRWTADRVSGEHSLGEAALTTRLEAQPGYTDRRVRDRYTVPVATGDVDAGRVFYPAATAIPFLFAELHLGWRVQLQSLEQTDRTVAQP